MQRTTTQHGFSLIELLVSLSLFTVVILMAVGTLLVLIDANAKAQSTQDVMMNLTFALDSMTREIRTGRSYYCTDTLPSSISEDSTLDCVEGTGLSIVEGGSSLTAGTGGSRIAYRLADGAVERRVGDGSWLPLTSDVVTITDMYFTVTGTDTYSESADLEQPTVTVFIEGTAGERADARSNFSIQTTVTRRTLDI